MKGKRTFQPNRRRRARHARLPGAHEHQERPPGPEAPPRQGPQAADGLVVAPAGQAARRASGARPRDRDVVRNARRAPARVAQVRRRAEFQQRAFDSGVSASMASYFTLLRRAAAPTRGRRGSGSSATRKLGGAVERNRAKRLIREMFRPSRLSRDAGARHRRDSAARAVRRRLHAASSEISAAPCGAASLARHRAAVADRSRG